MDYVTVINIHRTGQLTPLPGETESEFLDRMANSAHQEFAEHGNEVGAAVKVTTYRVNR
jgi:hypothetical protein